MPTEPATMATHRPALMPTRGDRTAPIFDQSKPQELLRFFDELEYLFDRTEMTIEADKKRQLLRYVDFEVERIWKTFPEYKDANKTYIQFKDAILKYYPDATGDFIYSLRDMDILIGERQRLGIATTNELNAYHMQFIAITSWLIEKVQLSGLEQQRAYIRAFQPQLLASINNRLQLKKPDHHPSIPYEVQDVYDAARFILQGATTSAQTFYTPHAAPIIQSVQQPVPDAHIKKEDLASLFSEFTKTLVGALSQNHGSNSRQPNSNFARALACLMCDGPHLVAACQVVTQYIKEGKCRRNHEGKVVLSTGAFVPREIPGKNLQERIDEWHKRNPNQLAAASLFNAVDLSTNKAVTLSPTDLDISFQLSTDDRIASLEAEIYNLRNKKNIAPPGMRTRAQKAKITTVEEDDEEAVAAVRSTRATVEEVVDEQADKAPSAPQSKVTQQPVTQEHPFRGAKDASYIPTIPKPVNGPAAVPQTNQKKPDGAYRTLPPIHDANIAASIYKRSMELPITITQRELLSLAPEVRSQVRDAVTTKRIQNKDNATAQVMMTDEYDDDYYKPSLPFVSAFAVPNACHRTPPAGANVIPDEYEAYIRSLRPGQVADPERLIVATDNVAIRSIFALVDNSLKKECILDPGCQIIAMSEHTCHELGLAYDPAIRLNMQSANGEVNQSLGLARNVPFLIGTITFYLQVHVIQSPAYDILLGRPFDILTESVVRNFSNEDQTITIQDPNTARRITIPTFTRTHRCAHKRQDF